MKTENKQKRYIDNYDRNSYVKQNKAKDINKSDDGTKSALQEYMQGDAIVLSCMFSKDGKTISPDKAYARILHESEGNIYEDISWTEMQKHNDGFIYTFDSSELDFIGTYTVVYKTEYEGETLNIMDNFNLALYNVSSNEQCLVYGFVTDSDNQKHKMDSTSVYISDMLSGNMIYQTETDADGRWEAELSPGSYMFKFVSEGFGSKEVKAQISDLVPEMQFNTVNMKKHNLSETGSIKIEDEFTDNTGLGIQGITVNIFGAEDVKNVICSAKTDIKGKWNVYLDPGNYVAEIILPSGLKKMFRLTVYMDRTKKMTEIRSAETVTDVSASFRGQTNGTEHITEYVLDAHGNGIENASVKAYEYNSESNDYVYVGETVTDISGQFELNLNKGKNKLIIACSNFKEKEIILNI